MKRSFYRTHLFSLFEQRFDTEEDFTVCSRCLSVFHFNKLPFKQVEELDVQSGCDICADQKEPLKINKIYAMLVHDSYSSYHFKRYGTYPK